MATITIDQLQKKLKKAAKALVKQADKYEALAAEESARLIKERTKRGFGVEKDGASKKKLKKLSPAYIKQRKREGLTAKSRLGRTDEMLDNVKAKKNKVVVDGQRNKELAEIAEDTGRPFLHLSKPEKKKVTEFIKDKVREFLANFQ